MKSRIAVISRILFCLLSLYGIAVTVGKMDDVLSGLSYYTVQSNLLCLIVMIIVLIPRKPSKTMDRVLSVLKSGSTVAILITFLVFHFVLRPGMLDSSWADYLVRFENIVVHYLCPLWFLADYLVFDPKGKIEKLDPFWWTLYPIGYFLYANVYAGLGGTYDDGESIVRYPYFFINPDLIGWEGVALWVGLVLTAFLVIAYGLFGMDRLFHHWKIKTPESA